MTVKKPDFDTCLEVLQEAPDLTNGDLSSFLDDGESLPSTDQWQEHWKGMPDFVQEEKKPYKKVNVCFQNKEDYEKFRALMDQPMTDKTKTIWFPPLDREKNSLYSWFEDATE
jgi:hypothetical protein